MRVNIGNIRNNTGRRVALVACLGYVVPLFVAAIAVQAAINFWQAGTSLIAEIRETGGEAVESWVACWKGK